MIATGMATVIASPAASRTLRSRTRRPTTDGPTPFPAGMPAGRGSIGSSLLGFGDFGADAIEKRPLRGQLRMPRQQGVGDLVGFEQQVLALVGRCGVCGAPEVALRARVIAVGEPHYCEAAGLPPVRLGIAPLSFFVGAERIGVAPAEEQRVSEVVVAEHERRVECDHLAKRRLRFVEAPQLA